MYYDDTTRRLNLVSGLALGAALGAGLALLFLPEERLQSGGRIVVRAARTLGRDVGDDGKKRRTPSSDGGADEHYSPARERAAKLARRKFKL